MPGDSGLVTIKQCGHLIESKPHCFVVDFYINMRQAIFRLIDDNFAFILVHIFTPVLLHASAWGIVFCVASLWFGISATLILNARFFLFLFRNQIKESFYLTRIFERDTFCIFYHDTCFFLHFEN